MCPDAAWSASFSGLLSTLVCLEFMSPFTQHTPLIYVQFIEVSSKPSVPNESNCNRLCSAPEGSITVLLSKLKRSSDMNL